MNPDTLTGPGFPEHGWVPAPRYVLRRARVLPMLEALAPGSAVLEVGPGAGALLGELAGRGMACQGLEASAVAREVARRVLEDTGAQVPIHDEPGTGWAGAFDRVIALDVLEHIQDDAKAVRDWARWLAPGGELVVSVPAHMALWTGADAWAGHFRRYEREDLVAVMERAGLEVVELECYGFPLANITEWINGRLHRNMARTPGQDDPQRQARNDRSGIDRGAHLRLFRLLNTLPGQAALRLATWVQGWFVHTDLGSGYLLRARMGGQLRGGS